MVDMGVEKFSAQGAIDAGLIDAIKSGVAKVSGTYEVGTDCKLSFASKVFNFIDKSGNLRLGKFEDTELINFWEMLSDENYNE